MSKIAVIKTGGKQYKVKEGDKLRVEKLLFDIGKSFSFDEVLLMANADGANIQIGAPKLTGAKVEAKVLEQGRGRKIKVVKYKSKVRYKKVFGHRQHFTRVEITKIAS